MPNKMLDKYGQKKDYVPRKAEEEQFTKKMVPANKLKDIEKDMDHDKMERPHRKMGYPEKAGPGLYIPESRDQKSVHRPSIMMGMGTKKKKM